MTAFLIRRSFIYGVWFDGAIVASISWASSILLLQSCSFGPANKLLLGFKPLPWPKNIIHRRPSSSPTPTAEPTKDQNSKGMFFSVELSLQHELSSSFSALQFFHLASATTPAVLVSFHSWAAPAMDNKPCYSVIQEHVEFKSATTFRLFGEVHTYIQIWNWNVETLVWEPHHPSTVKALALAVAGGGGHGL